MLLLFAKSVLTARAIRRLRKPTAPHCYALPPVAIGVASGYGCAITKLYRLTGMDIRIYNGL